MPRPLLPPDLYGRPVAAPCADSIDGLTFWKKALS